jgi:hypothetical protein
VGHGFKSNKKGLVPVTNILTLECRLDEAARRAAGSVEQVVKEGVMTEQGHGTNVAHCIEIDKR